MESKNSELGDGVEPRNASIEDRTSNLEQSVKDLQCEVASLKTVVERALSSLLPRVESLLNEEQDASCASTAHGTSLQDAPSASSSHGTSVPEAAAAGDAVALLSLLANGGDSNARDSNGVPALHLAAANGHVEAVGVLLERGALVDVVGPELRTALHVASAKGHVDVARRLLYAGAKIEMEDAVGYSPLMLALRAKQCRIVPLLVEKGADPNKTVLDYKSALEIAAAEGQIDIVKVMLRLKKPHDTFIRIALSHAKNASVVWAFEDVLPGTMRKEGGAAMREAASKGRLESMVALLDVGVSIEAKDDEGTALICASRHGHVECVKELLHRGALLDVESQYRYTALHLASCEGKEEVVRLLLDAGADVNITNTYGKTALDIAKTETIKTMIRESLKS